MPSIRKWKEGTLHKYSRKLRWLLRKPLMIAIVLTIATGLVLLGVANTMNYTYQDHVSQKTNVQLSSGMIENITFGTFIGYPANVTFEYSGTSAVVQYSIFKVVTEHPSIFFYNNTPVPVTNGDAQPGQTVFINANLDYFYYGEDNTFGQLYYMHVEESSSNNASIPLQIDVVSIIPAHHHGNPILGTTGEIFILAGIGLTAFFVTIEVRKKEK